MVWFDGGTLGAVFMREEEVMTRPRDRYNVAPVPFYSWVPLLTIDAMVYLVKEDMFASVSMRWAGETERNTRFGRICIRKVDDRNVALAAEAWIIDDMGRGVDGRPLMQPVEGFTHPLMYSRPQITPDPPQPATRSRRPLRNIKLRRTPTDGHRHDCEEGES